MYRTSTFTCYLLTELTVGLMLNFTAISIKVDYPNFWQTCSCPDTTNKAKHRVFVNVQPPERTKKSLGMEFTNKSFHFPSA